MDLTLQEIIGKMMEKFKLAELQELIKLLNYCTLMEKLRFAKFSSEFGCSYCNKSMPLYLPKDMISIVSGDPEYPLEDRTFLLARTIFDSLCSTNSQKKGVAVIGSYHSLEVLKAIIELFYNYKDTKIEEFIRQDLLKNNIFHFQSTGSKLEQIEKLAILETIHQSIDPSLVEKNELEEDEDYIKYVEYLDHYGHEISYEKLAENNEEIKITPGDCLADILVFGDSNQEDMSLGGVSEKSLSETIQSITRDPEADEQPVEKPQKIKLKEGLKK